jgi:hypothetical protein
MQNSNSEYNYISKAVQLSEHNWRHKCLHGVEFHFQALIKKIQASLTANHLTAWI